MILWLIQKIKGQVLFNKEDRHNNKIILLFNKKNYVNTDYLLLD